jgi:cytochrome c oxidase subunit 4
MTVAAEAAMAVPAVGTTEEHAKRPYVYVFLVLAVVTLLEVYASGLEFLAIYRITILIVMATVKASLVAAYYMHLRYEPRWIMLIPFGALALVFILVAALTASTGQVPPIPQP